MIQIIRFRGYNAIIEVKNVRDDVFFMEEPGPHQWYINFVSHDLKVQSKPCRIHEVPALKDDYKQLWKEIVERKSLGRA